ALRAVRVHVVRADEPAVARVEHHVPAVVGDHHVARLGLGQRNRTPAVRLQVGAQLGDRGARLLLVDETGGFQTAGDEVGAVDVVRHPRLHRGQLAAHLQVAGVAAEEPLSDLGRVVAARVDRFGRAAVPGHSDGAAATTAATTAAAAGDRTRAGGFVHRLRAAGRLGLGRLGGHQLDEAVLDLQTERLEQVVDLLLRLVQRALDLLLLAVGVLLVEGAQPLDLRRRGGDLVLVVRAVLPAAGGGDELAVLRVVVVGLLGQLGDLLLDV